MISVALFSRSWCDECGNALLMMTDCADCRQEAKYGQGVAVIMMVEMVLALAMIVTMLPTRSNRL